MSVSVFKTWAADEVLTASDLNNSFTQITSNGEDLGWPATKAKDLDGQQLTLDGDADTHFTADTDDRLDLSLGGVDLFRWDGTVASPLNGIDFIAGATGVNGNLTATGETNAGINLVPKGTGVIQAAGAALLIAGKHTIWVPAAAMRSTVSNGCSSLGSVETTAGNPDMQVLDFDTGADEAAQFQIAWPKSWNEGTVTFKAFWTVSAAVTTGVAIAVESVAVSDNETIDASYGTPIVVTDDAQGATEELLVTAESSAVTIGGTPAEGDCCFFRVFRDISDANDDMTQDMRLIGIQLFYTLNARDDT